MSRLGKAKREREEACYICGHYHDVSSSLMLAQLRFALPDLQYVHAKNDVCAL